MGMPDPKNDPATDTSASPAPQAPASQDPPFGFQTRLWGGMLTGRATEPSPGLYQGNADYQFRNGDLLGAQLRLQTDPRFALDQYGLNGRFGLGDGGNLRFDASASPPTDTYRIGSQLQLSNGNLFNLDWNRTLQGQNYGGDGSFKLGGTGTGTATFRVDEPAGTAQANTALNFDPNTRLNADWLRNRDGQIYGADAAFRLGQTGNGTAAFRVDEPAGTAQANTALNFDANTRLNADWLRNRDGQIYGADAAFKLGQSGNGTAAFRVDEPNGTAKANTALNFDANTHLNADWLRNRDGQIYGADAAFKLGQSGNGTAAFRVDEPAGTAQANTALNFDANTRLNADWLRNRDGQVYGADAAFRLGQTGNGTAAFRVDEPNGTAKANTALNFDANTHLNADWLRNRDGQIYGADAAFRLGQTGNGTAAFRVDEPNGTAKANTALNFDANTHLNADWLRNRDGQVYGADAAFRLGQTGNGTAAFRVDEPNGTAKANTALNFDANTHLNADWLRNRDGQVYGADAAFRLGQSGNGTAAFRVDEPAGTSMFNTRLKLNDDFSLNADYNNTKAGRIYGADTAFKLGKDGDGTAAFRIDEPAGTSMFNTRLKWNDGFGLGADYTNTKAGAIYGADATFRLGQNGSGTGGFRVDEPAQTSSLNSKLLFGNGDRLDFDLSKSPAGHVYGAEAAFGVGRDGKGLAGFRIDEPNGTSNYKLGASFPNGNELNATLMKDRVGTSFGVGAKVGFNDGAGSLGVDGKFGPFTDVGGSINFRNKDLEYSGVVRADNRDGPFRVSEFGAKLTTKGSDRYQFTAEAGYRPETHETYGRVGLTIHFGGGSSRPSRPITHAPDPVPLPEPVRPIAAREPRAMVSPEHQGLYEQAVSGVQRLNGSGARLPVEETAASLAVLAKQNGIRHIEYVSLGNPTSDGKQNLFIGDGAPGSPTARQAHIDRTQAAGTPLAESLQKLDAAPVAQTGAQQQTMSPGHEPATTARRAAM